MHALVWVWVQVRQPDHGLLTIVALLRNAQPATPQRFHTIVGCVLGVVPELLAACAIAGLLVDVLEQRDTVLKQLDRGGGMGCVRALAGQCKGCALLARQHRHRPELALNVLGQVLKITRVALGQYAHRSRRSVLGLVVVRTGEAQYSGRVGGHRHVNAQTFLLTQALEVLCNRLPFLNSHVLGERPVAVQATA